MPNESTESGRPSQFQDHSSVQLPCPDFNLRFDLTVVPEFVKSDPRSSLRLTPLGIPGQYRVTYILAIPGKETYKSALNWQHILSNGESLLLMKGLSEFGMKFEAPASGIKVDLVGYANDKGQLSRIVARLQAQDIPSATRTAHDIVMPMLSWWSVRYDLSIDVAAWEVLHEETGLLSLSVGVLGRSKQFEIELEVESVLPPAYRNVFSAYREGMNATNPFYQALSYYKVIEGLKRLRQSRRAFAKKKGSVVSEPQERIPKDVKDIPVTDVILRHNFLPYLGKAFGSVIDGFRPLIRNAIAHLDPGEDSLNADKFEDTSTCMEAIPVLKHIAREMIRHEIQYDPQCKGSNLL